MKRCASFLILIIFLVLPVSKGFSQKNKAVSKAGNNPKIELNNLWGVGVKVGLNGVGLEVIKGLGDKVNVRLGYSWLSIPYSTVQDIEDYRLQIDAKVNLGGASLLADYYVYKNIFHVTGGLVLNTTLVGIDIKSLSSFPYGDITIPAEDVGAISGRLGPGNLLSPYIALGAGNTLSKKHRLSFNFELGTFYQGHPQIELAGNGVIGPMASENNTAAINNAISQYSWFPMLNVQLTYRIK